VDKNYCEMYESSCSYQSALDLKRTASSPSNSIIKSEDFNFAQNPTEWNNYGFHQSTFERLKQSVEKAKAALQDRTFLGSTSAFSELYTAQRSNDSTDNASLGLHNSNNISINSSPLANSNHNNNNSQNSLNNNHSNANNNGLTSNGNNQRLHHSQDSTQDLSKHRQQSEFFASLKFSSYCLHFLKFLSISLDN
jgi:friend leukemia integration 1 transcription factor